MVTYINRLERDIENIAKMAKDDIDAALGHMGTKVDQATVEVDCAINNLKQMKLLMRDFARES